MKTWIRLATLVLVFSAGLWAGQTGLLPSASLLAQDGGDGSAGGITWTDDGATIEITNLDPEFAYAVVVTYEDEESYLTLGGAPPILHLEETVTVEKTGLKGLSVYAMVPTIALDDLEIVRPCDDPLIDCPQPGRPPVPPWMKTAIVFPQATGPGGGPVGIPVGDPKEIPKDPT